MSNTITIGELRDLLEHEKIKPSKLFDKKDFLADPKLMKALADKRELEDYRAEKKKKQELKEKDDDASFIPD